MPRTSQSVKPKKSAKRARTYRFDARLNREQKLLIQRAADLEGRSMTDFVIQSAQAAAARTIEERSVLVLSARDSLAFAEAILNPPDPGPGLRRAAREYLESMGKK